MSVNTTHRWQRQIGHFWRFFRFKILFFSESQNFPEMGCLRIQDRFKINFHALTRPRPGVSVTFARRGGGRIPAPTENSKTKKDSDKRKTALDRPQQVLQKIKDHLLIKSNLRSQGVKKGQIFSKSGYFHRKSQLSQKLY